MQLPHPILLLTELVSDPDEFDKPEYQDEYVFIDVLCVPQGNVVSAQVVQTTKSTYSKCWLVIFVAGNCLSRAWCALEIAVGTSTGCKLTVIGSCDLIDEKKFFEKLDATVESDIKLIKEEILCIFHSKEEFNEVVARAMQVLFVFAQKNTKFSAFKFGTPREQRTGWIAKMQSKTPKMTPRDRLQDWSIIVGDTSAVSLEETRRVVRVFLSSTFSDTVIEWSFFLQDVVPYLKVCARNRGLDFDVSDMRFGNTPEESLPVEVRLAELERCGNESAGMFYVLIAGNKKGPSPAPVRIPKVDFDGMLSRTRGADSELVKTMYALDENQLDRFGQPAPEYCLQDTVPSATERARLEGTLHEAGQEVGPKQADLSTVAEMDRYVCSISTLPF